MSIIYFRIPERAPATKSLILFTFEVYIFKPGVEGSLEKPPPQRIVPVLPRTYCMLKELSSSCLAETLPTPRPPQLARPRSPCIYMQSCWTPHGFHRRD